MSTLIIARLTFHEASRRRILWLAVLLSLAFLAIYALGFNVIFREMRREMGSRVDELREAINFFVMAGLYVVNFLIAMVAVLASVDTISGEIASQTIQVVATKPIARWEIVLGKWLGFVLMLAGYVALLAGGVMLVGYLIADYLPPNPIQGILLMYMEGVVFISLTMLGGTTLSTLANGVLAFMLYGLAFVGGWIEQIGALVRNETAVNLGIVTSLIMPSEALWKRAAYLMQPPLVRELGFTPFSTMVAPSQAMVVYAGLYIVVTLALAIRLFSRRDL